MASNKPEAKQFKRWITHDVLPTIRKHGFYAVEKPPSLPQMTQTQIIAAVAQHAAEQEQKLLALENRTETMERRRTLVKDTMIQREDDWHDNVNKMINKIVERKGDKDYQGIMAESYEILEERAGCDLSARIRNLKQRLADSGATKAS